MEAEESASVLRALSRVMLRFCEDTAGTTLQDASYKVHCVLNGTFNNMEKVLASNPKWNIMP